MHGGGDSTHVSIHLSLPGFTLDAGWAASDGVTVLFGPSGAGKTLTLRCLAGLTRPDRGRIEVGGRVVFDSAAGADVHAVARRIGCVFQRGTLFPHLTVLDNVAFGLRDHASPDRATSMAEVIE